MHTLHTYLFHLHAAGKKARLHGNRYIITQCPTHPDRIPSAQVFTDGWVDCKSGCGRFHISKVFPELREDNKSNYEDMSKTVEETRVYKNYELIDQWRGMEELPPDFQFKGIPVDVLNGLGWRKYGGQVQGLRGDGIFMPYFNHDKTKIPFAQLRHLDGSRRFTFLPDAKITLYGKWNISPGATLFIVEGLSDAAVMEYAMVPWISVPSASCATQLKEFAKYSIGKDIRLVYAGDNDEAGNRLLEAIDREAPYRICQPPKEYKDWGDFLEAEGVEAIIQRCEPELYEDVEYPLKEVALEVFGSDKSVQGSLIVTS